MQVDDWLASAIADAERRGLPQLKPLLETLARTTTNLRKADEALRDEEAAAEPHGEPR
jgi:hypothetical protein